MKYLYPIFCLVLISCNSDRPERITEDYYYIEIELEGECFDLERPSRFKEKDSYEVSGFFYISKDDSYISDTEEVELSSLGRISAKFDSTKFLDWPNLSGKGYVDSEKEFYSIDTPRIIIDRVPKDLISKKKWNLPAIHNYDDTGEDHSIYADRKAECALNVIKKEGSFTQSYRDIDEFCFDIDGDCFAEKLHETIDLN